LAAIKPLLEALSRLAKIAGKKGYLETARVGPPKGLAGTFFGTKIPERLALKEGVRIALPTKGKDILNLISHEIEGNSSTAPLADAVSLTRDISVPRKLAERLAKFDTRDSTWGEDLVGAISLKRKGINFVHFINPENTEAVSVDLSQHTIQELLKQLNRMLELNERIFY
jgi:hypothetical protein